MKSNIDIVLVLINKRMTACSKQVNEEFYVRNEFFYCFKTTLLILTEVFLMYQLFLRQYG